MAQVGLRVNEARMLDLDDVRWDLGRFGKLHVRHGKGARGSGPRERMVPLMVRMVATPFLPGALCCFRHSPVPSRSRYQPAAIPLPEVKIQTPGGHKSEYFRAVG
jgi:hypothetical protein